MREITLVQIEAGGIQDYIFGSNNLRQNIGASELVARATTEQVVRALNQTVGAQHHNVSWGDGRVRYDEARTIAADNVRVEVVYAGGGNALLIFVGGYETVRPFVTALTTWLVRHADGLSLTFHHRELDWEGDALSSAHSALRQEMVLLKAGRRHPTPLLGLSVTAACAFTGLPAVERDSDGRLVSCSVQQKLKMTEGRPGRSLADERLIRLLSEEAQEQHEFVRDFDYFGTRGESSYIAVVHTDGNKMGHRFQAIADAHRSANQNGAYVTHLRRMSEAVIETASRALATTIARLVNSKRTNEDGQPTWDAHIPVRRDKSGLIQIPFRPIVFGGDDTTFVCEGRHGLDLTMHYLQELAANPLPGDHANVEGQPLYARAGVAIVKSHYPFARAYQLAEALSGTAKKALNEAVNPKPSETGIVLDWHVSTSGALLQLKKIREREYTADSGASLLMRPIWHTAPDWRSWKNFRAITGAFQDEEQWARNKVKALRDALRHGAPAVEAFRNNFGVALLPEVENLSATVRKKGWSGQDTPYFDPIEMTDFFVSLDPPEVTDGK